MSVNCRLLLAPCRHKRRDEHAFSAPFHGSFYKPAVTFDSSSPQRIEQTASNVPGSARTTCKGISCLTIASLDRSNPFDQEYSTSSMRTQNTAPLSTRVDSPTSEPSRPISTHDSKYVAQRKSSSTNNMLVLHVPKIVRGCSPFFESLQRLCTTCGIGDSPEWRKGPDGHKTLCNACGLRHWRNVSRARRRFEKESLHDQVGKGKGLPSCRTKFAKRKQQRGMATKFVWGPSSTNFEYFRMSMPSSAAEVQEQLRPIYIEGGTPASAESLSQTMQTLCKKRTGVNEMQASMLSTLHTSSLRDEIDSPVRSEDVGKRMLSQAGMR